MTYDVFPVAVDYRKVGAAAPKHPAQLHGWRLSPSDEIPAQKEKPAVIVCPGGGYSFRSDRENEPIAMKLLAEGIHAFVLDYSVAPARYPDAALELAAAVRLVRQHATEWHVLPDQIYVMGFSAGGHLACTLGTLWDDTVFHQALGGAADWRPNGQVLCYPVITMGEFTHEGSRDCLLGAPADPAMVEKLSLETQVTSRTVPTFLWHTVEDDCVPCENSLMYATALRKAGVPFELHLFEQGGHGLATCDRLTASEPAHFRPDNAGWMDQAIRFILRRID